MDSATAGTRQHGCVRSDALHALHALNFQVASSFLPFKVCYGCHLYPLAKAIQFNPCLSPHLPLGHSHLMHASAGLLTKVDWFRQCDERCSLEQCQTPGACLRRGSEQCRLHHLPTAWFRYHPAYNSAQTRRHPCPTQLACGIRSNTLPQLLFSDVGCCAARRGFGHTRLSQKRCWQLDTFVS